MAANDIQDRQGGSTTQLAIIGAGLAAKSLMETGEIATHASPSGRASESPSQPRI